MLIICAVIGSVSRMPAAVRGAMITRDTWLLAIAGGLLLAAFLVLAARYIRLYLRSVEWLGNDHHRLSAVP